MRPSIYRGPSVFGGDGPCVHWWDRPEHRLRHEQPQPQVHREPPPLPSREREPELLAMLRRIHESAHVIAGHIGGLHIKRVCARRDAACAEWFVPASHGSKILVAYLIALAASRHAQQRFGARHNSYDFWCSDDERKIEEMARRIARSDADAERLIGAVHVQAERLVNERWRDIEYIANALEKLDDEIGDEDIQRLLRHVDTGRSERLLYRRGFISDELWTRRGLARPRGYDRESREIDAVLSTGARVRRRDWDGEFDEVLGMQPHNVRLARLNQGAAVLDSHNWSGVGAMLGGIVPGTARLEDGALVARIKFSRGSELARRIAQDLQDGIQIPLSAGYKVHRTVDDRSTVPTTRTAVDWEPIEVSVVPIAAEESGTGFRAAA
jgi:hypothetical protein